MHLGLSILRLLIVLAGVALMFVSMKYLGVFAHWTSNLDWYYSLPIAAVFLLACMIVAIWIEKKEHKRRGAKYRPFTRWNND